jgi:hypothetical protein
VWVREEHQRQILAAEVAGDMEKVAELKNALAEMEAQRDYVAQARWLCCFNWH